MICVVNKRSGGKGIYIGRGNRHTRGSPLGNPFKMNDESDRDYVVEQYEAWLTNEMKKDTSAAKQEVLRIAAMVQRHCGQQRGDAQPVNLVCWCAPKRCHGDVVKKIVEEAVRLERNEEDSCLQPMQCSPALTKDAAVANQPPQAKTQEPRGKALTKQRASDGVEAKAVNTTPPTAGTQKAGDATPATPQKAGEAQEGTAAPDPAKRRRKIKKLLRQIDNVKAKAERGSTLNSDEQTKLNSEAALRHELASMLMCQETSA